MWCRNQESNSGPDDYKSTALPSELLRRCLVERVFKGIGPVTQDLFFTFFTFLIFFFDALKKSEKN